MAKHMLSVLLMLTLPSLVVPGDVLTTRDYYTQSRQPPVPPMTTKLGLWSTFGFQCRYQVSPYIGVTFTDWKPRVVMGEDWRFRQSWFHDNENRRSHWWRQSWHHANARFSMLQYNTSNFMTYARGRQIAVYRSSICWLSCDTCESIITYSCIACGYNNEGPFRDWYSVHHANYNNSFCVHTELFSGNIEYTTVRHWDGRCLKSFLAEGNIRTRVSYVFMPQVILDIFGSPIDCQWDSRK